MAISAAQVKELRERTGAGMMECKKALSAVDGDIEAAIEHLRKTGLAKADKKSGRIAAEGRIMLAEGDEGTVLVEINCETDFVAKDESFLAFAEAVAAAAATGRHGDVAALLQAEHDGATLDEARQALIAKIGENIQVRRMARVEPAGTLGAYLHGTKIGVLVDVENGDEALARDLAMHVAASRPEYVREDEIPEAVVAKEKAILMAQAEASGKPADIVEKMVGGRLRKNLAALTLEGQPFVKDQDLTVGKLLAQHKARVAGFVRLEVGEGIEKDKGDFAAEVMAQVRGG